MRTSPGKGLDGSSSGRAAYDTPQTSERDGAPKSTDPRDLQDGDVGHTDEVDGVEQADGIDGTSIDDVVGIDVVGGLDGVDGIDGTDHVDVRMTDGVDGLYGVDGRDGLEYQDNADNSGSTDDLGVADGKRPMRDQDGVASKSTSKVDGKPEEKVPRAASYELRMLQHPARVRCCGYGNKDRRTIDPCPVLELVCLDATGAAIESVNEAPFLVCHASIWSEDGQEDSSLIENMHSHKQRSLDSSATQNLVGSLTNLSRPLRDVDNQKKLLFVFADLSVRLPGMFTLRFQLLDVSFGRHDEGVGSYMVGHSYMGGAPQLAMIQTKPFESYRPKLFPGMLQTTALSKKLAQQGVSEIRVRKDPVPRPS